MNNCIINTKEANLFNLKQFLVTNFINLNYKKKY